MDNREILLIHMGGLGDVCLSESVFHSLTTCFGKNIIALGTRRFFALFEEYFTKIEGIESARWLPLFSERPLGMTWDRIIFIGKDRRGDLRKRWRKLSRNELVFLEMYPEGGFPAPDEKSSLRDPIKEVHVEDFQLEQLGGYGIEAIKKEVTPSVSRRVILYPEAVFQKRKWPAERFAALCRSLRRKGVDACILGSPGLKLDVEEKVFFQELGETRRFLQKGGIFVSNDSGMAHLAGATGLYTITMFADFDHKVWHPRGRNVSLSHDPDTTDPQAIEALLLDVLKKQGTAS